MHSVLVKRLRNKKKKMEKIQQTEKKIKKKEIDPTEEQLEMVASKGVLDMQIKELETLVDNFKKEAKDQKKAAAKEAHKPAPPAPEEAKEEAPVTASHFKFSEAEVIERTLALVADAALVALLSPDRYEGGIRLDGAGDQALAAVVSALDRLRARGATVSYEDTKAQFVATFSALA